jgi:hypothetical protein
MAVWNQAAGWSSGSLAIEGSTSGRELLRFDKDNITIPPLRGRVNVDITPTALSGGAVVGSVANPTTEELWVEGIIVNIDTASSSSSLLSIGIATADSSSASNIANATVGCSTAGLLALNSSNAFPVAWNATSFLTLYVTSSSSFAVLDGNVTAFYVAATNT